MHNMDRILNEEEYSQEYGFLHEGETQPPFGAAHEYAQEGEDEWEGESQDEWANEEEYDGEYGHELSHEQYEQMEYEMAAELLAVTNEAELDQFFGKLVKRVGRGISGFARSNVGRSLIGGLKSVAKIGLPIAGKVVGGMFGGPIGGKIGSKLGSMAANLFEIQMEGMSPEDREFEVARRIVRTSTAATKKAMVGARKMPNAAPRAIATRAIKLAAAQHAPGLLRPTVQGKRPGITINPSGKPGNTGVAGGTRLIGILGGGFGNTFGYPSWGGYPPQPPYGNPYSGGGGGGAASPSPDPAPAGDGLSNLPASGTWTRQGDQITLTL